LHPGGDKLAIRRRKEDWWTPPKSGKPFTFVDFARTEADSPSNSNRTATLRVGLAKGGEKMPAAKTYLVPIDFSRGSEIALHHALALARDKKGKIILLHVIPATLVYPSEGTTFDFYTLMERDARKGLEQLVRRNRLKPANYRFVLMRAADTSQAIARQARKLHASMIVMGSHGRTGLKRFILGSVAERTLRYATCPVLIVKK
jgi:nucleotide-binding universal stress UspA family protein